MNAFDDDFDVAFNVEMDVDGSEMEPELSLNEKHEAIMEQIRKIVLDYWQILQHYPYSHTTLSPCCFIVQDMDLKFRILKVLPTI